MFRGGHDSEGVSIVAVAAAPEHRNCEDAANGYPYATSARDALRATTKLAFARGLLIAGFVMGTEHRFRFGRTFLPEPN